MMRRIAKTKAECEPKKQTPKREQSVFYQGQEQGWMA